MSRAKNTLLKLGGIFAGVLVVAWVAWAVAPCFVQDPMVALARQTPVRTWRDRNGQVLWHERTFDAQWRFHVPLNEISPWVPQVIIAAEDGNFYEHRGVDYSASIRALIQNLLSWRKISGASTISMQLAGMALPGRHTFFWKLHQATVARKLERLHSKDEILEEYLNRIPFGGKLFGIEAAAQYYFGLPAAKLNLAEATLLCGLPQKPNKFRPDRYLESARERQRIVLKLLVRSRLFSVAEAERIFATAPLRFRNFAYPPHFMELGLPGEYYHSLRLAGNCTTETSLDLVLTRRIQALMQAQCDRLPQVEDGAALLLNNRTGQVLVYLGTLDFYKPGDGQVDAIQAVRSAGSTLKPFLYAEAVQAGLMVADTKLLDAPLRMDNYSPGNFDGTYCGEVTARYALAHSLNTPAVRLAAQLGAERTLEALSQFGVTECSSQFGTAPGLSIAMGSGGTTLWRLVRGYAMLANGGILKQPVFQHQEGFQKLSFRENHGNGVPLSFSSPFSIAIGWMDPPPGGKKFRKNQENSLKFSQVSRQNQLKNATILESLGGSMISCDNGREVGEGELRLLPQAVCTMVSGMLRSRPLGFSSLDVAWKTGTSNNNCDAWCVAYTPDFTLGIWFGNKNGKPAPALIGAEAALPVAAEIFEILYQGRPHPQWEEENAVLAYRELCKRSGLLPTIFCEKQDQQRVIPGLPLRTCTACHPAEQSGLVILSPLPGEYKATPGEKRVILPLQASLPDCTWYINNRLIGRGLKEYAFPANARYRLRAVENSLEQERMPQSAEVLIVVTE